MSSTCTARPATTSSTPAAPRVTWSTWSTAAVATTIWSLPDMAGSTAEPAATTAAPRRSRAASVSRQWPSRRRRGLEVATGNPEPRAAARRWRRCRCRGLLGRVRRDAGRRPLQVVGLGPTGFGDLALGLHLAHSELTERLVGLRPRVVGQVVAHVVEQQAAEVDEQPGVVAAQLHLRGIEGGEQQLDEQLVGGSGS